MISPVIENPSSRGNASIQSSCTTALAPLLLIWAGCCSSSLEETQTENDANNVSQVQSRHDIVLAGTR